MAFEEFHQLEQILNQSRVAVTRAEYRMGVGIRRAPARFFNDLNRIKRENLELARLLAEYQSRTGQAGLGFVVSALIGGAAVGVSVIAGWIWKNRAESQDLEQKTSIVRQLIDEQGMDPDKAAQLLFGSQSSVSELLDKLTVLMVLGVGAWALIKWKK